MINKLLTMKDQPLVVRPRQRRDPNGIAQGSQDQGVTIPELFAYGRGQHERGAHGYVEDAERRESEAPGQQGRDVVLDSVVRGEQKEKPDGEVDNFLHSQLSPPLKFAHVLVEITRLV